MEETEGPEETRAGTEEQCVLAALESAIDGALKKLGGKKATLSVADLLRLMEARREAAKAEPARITVEWIDEWPQTPASEG